MSDLPLFVYGTLLSTGRRAGLVGPRRRGPGWITGTLWHLPAGYPAVTLGGDGKVHGEWIDPVPLRVLAVLDRYEGVDEGLYRRVVVPVQTDTARFDAWAWVMDDPTEHRGVVVPAGRWSP